MKQQTVLDFTGLTHEQLVDLYLILDATRKSTERSVLSTLLRPAFDAVDEELSRRKQGRGGHPIAMDIRLEVSTSDLSGILTVWDAFIRGLGFSGAVFAPIAIALRRCIAYRKAN